VAAQEASYSCRVGGRSRARLALVLLSAVCAWRMPAAAQPPSDIQAIVTRVGERVADYYRRAQRLICTETSTVLPIEPNWSPVGMARTVESELHFELASIDGNVDTNIVRKVLLINGRAPRPRDKKDTHGCTDPEPFSPASLDFLLPSHQREYRFTSSVHEDDRDGRTVIGIDFKSADSKSEITLRENPRGLDGCYQMVGSIPREGRVWVDAQTYDVIRVEQHNEGPVDIRVPWKMRGRDGLPNIVTLDRDDFTLDYHAIAFNDPAETLVLPSAIDEMMLWRGALQSTRRTTRYADYHRFMTNGRIVKD
jgi:hypothetical protein